MMTAKTVSVIAALHLRKERSNQSNACFNVSTYTQNETTIFNLVDAHDHISAHSSYLIVTSKSDVQPVQ